MRTHIRGVRNALQIMFYIIIYTTSDDDEMNGVHKCAFICLLCLGKCFFEFL